MQAWTVGEFESGDQLIKAAHRMREIGFTNHELDGYSPYPVEGLGEALGLAKSVMPKIMLVGGLLGVCCGYGLIYFCNVFDFPINVGGRSIHGIPSFIPITFECGILFAALSAFFGVLMLMGFPRPYHPVFEVAPFIRASQDRFFLSVNLDVTDLDRRATAKKTLEELGASEVSVVEADEQ